MMEYSPCQPTYSNSSKFEYSQRYNMVEYGLDRPGNSSNDRGTTWWSMDIHRGTTWWGRLQAYSYSSNIHV